MTHQPQIAPNAVASRSAPYGSFVFALICMTVAIAGEVFVIAAATTQGTPDAFDKFTEGVGWFVGMIATGFWAKRIWSEILRIEDDPVYQKKHRSFALRVGGTIAAFLWLLPTEAIWVFVQHISPK